MRRSAYLSAYALSLLAALVQTGAASAEAPGTLSIALAAPAEEGHFAWAAAKRLQRAAREMNFEVVLDQASWSTTAAPQPDLLIMPVRSLATLIPDLQVLELPFFYPSLAAVHRAVDGGLGEDLARAVRENGWEITAYWDEGMHVLSGLKRYDRVRNLKAREFLVTRPDPMAQRQFGYWKADVRRITPQRQDDVLRECVIAGRAATLQEIAREELFRVHFTVSLSNHRYEGWVVVAPLDRWKRIDKAKAKKLMQALRSMSAWQRQDTRDRETAALATLKRHGMTVQEVDAREREAFRKALPDWVKLLPDTLTLKRRRELIALASFGTTAVTGSGNTSMSTDTRHNSLPRPDGR